MFELYSLTEILGCLVVGIGVGLVSSFLGFGGGTIIVPLLPWINHHSTKSAIATSLFIIAINSARNTIAFHQKKIIDWGIIQKTVPFAVLFALISSSITNLASAGIVNWLLVLIFSFLVMITVLGEKHTPFFLRQQNFRNFFLAGSGVGFLSGLSGIGGGTFLVPLMMAGQWVSPIMISPTGNAINFFTTTTGSLILATSSDLIQYQSAFWILTASILTSQWARPKQTFLKASTRRIWIAGFLGTVILKLLWQAILGKA